MHASKHIPEKSTHSWAYANPSNKIRTILNFGCVFRFIQVTMQVSMCVPGSVVCVPALFAQTCVWVLLASPLFSELCPHTGLCHSALCHSFQLLPTTEKRNDFNLHTYLHVKYNVFLPSWRLRGFQSWQIQSHESIPFHLSLHRR